MYVQYITGGILSLLDKQSWLPIQENQYQNITQTASNQPERIIIVNGGHEILKMYNIHISYNSMHIELCF